MKGVTAEELAAAVERGKAVTSEILTLEVTVQTAFERLYDLGGHGAVLGVTSRLMERLSSRLRADHGFIDVAEVLARTRDARGGQA